MADEQRDSGGNGAAWLIGGMVLSAAVLLALLGSGGGMPGAGGGGVLPGGGGDPPPTAGDDEEAKDVSMFGHLTPTWQWELTFRGELVQVDKLRPGFWYTLANFPYDQLQPGQDIVVDVTVGRHGTVEEFAKKARARVKPGGKVWLVTDTGRPPATVGAALHLRAIFPAEHEAEVVRQARRLCRAPKFTKAGRFIGVEGAELDAMGEAEALRMASELSLPLVRLVRL